MDIFDAISPDEIARFEPQIGAAPLLIADANLSEVRYTHTRTRTHTRTHTHTHTHTHQAPTKTPVVRYSQVT